MKTTVLSATLLTLLAAAPALQAQEPPPPITGSVAPLTLALKRSYSSPGVVKKDENGKPIKKGPKVFSNFWQKEFPQYELLDVNIEWVSVVKTEKYSNKELLLDLISLGVLPQKGAAPHLAGWSIQRGAPTFPGPSSADAPGLGEIRAYAKHKDGDIVDISHVLKIMNGPAAEKWKSTTLEMYSTFMGTSLLETRHGLSATENGCAFMELDFRALTPDPADDDSHFVSIARFQGIRSSGFTLTSVGKSKAPVIKLAGFKASGISGYGFAFEYNDGENGPNPHQVISVISGAISSPAGALLGDFGSYLPVP